MNNNNTHKALVDEVLTKDEVMNILNMTIGRNGTVNDYVTAYKGTFTAWDGEEFSGYIVAQYKRTATSETVNDYMPEYVETEDYYFMEVTLEEVDNPHGNCHLWEPTFHRLMPISNYSRQRKYPDSGDVKDLCNTIIANACRDMWKYTEVPMTKEEIEAGKKKDWWWYTHHTTKIVALTYNDIYCHWSTPLTMEEQKQREEEKRERERALLNLFSSTLPAADDSAWYSVLSMGCGTEGYDFECKVLKMLNDNGIHAYIDGERDSFGWVTRGIFINGKAMCMY